MQYNLNKSEQISTAVLELYEKKCYADVDIIVGGEHFAAHRAILGTRSAFFKKLLLNSSQDELKTELCLRVPLHPFKLLLAYFYTGKLHLASEASMADALELIKLAKLFELSDVVGELSHLLSGNLNINNVVDTLKWSFVNRDYPIITEACFGFMERHVKALLKHSTFNSMSSHALGLLLQRNTFGAAEEDIFHCVLAWHKANPNADLEPLLRNIRFALFDLRFLVKVVHAADIIALPLLFDILEEQFASSVQPRVLCVQGKEVIFDLGKPTIMVSLRFDITHVENTEGIPYSVHSSLDREEWSLIEDRSDGLFKDEQVIKLQEMETRFIKIETLSDKTFNVENLLAEKSNYEERDFACTENGGKIEMPDWGIRNYATILTIKLNRKRALHRIEINHVQNADNYRTEITIERSLDGRTWHFIGSGMCADQDSFVHQMNKVEAKYIRLSGDDYFSFDRIKCIGKVFANKTLEKGVRLYD